MQLERGHQYLENFLADVLSHLQNPSTNEDHLNWHVTSITELHKQQSPRLNWYVTSISELHREQKERLFLSSGHESNLTEIEKKVYQFNAHAVHGQKSDCIKLIFRYDYQV